MAARLTHSQEVGGSSPSPATHLNWSYGLMARMSPCHGEDEGSIPYKTAIRLSHLLVQNETTSDG